MKAQKTPATIDKETASGRVSLFDRSNYVWMLAGAAVLILGFLLMAGGRSENPAVFEPAEVYSFTRTTVAPILILAGLVIEIYALFRHPKNGAR